MPYTNAAIIAMLAAAPIIRAVLPRDSTADMLKGSRATAVIIYR